MAELEIKMEAQFKSRANGQKKNFGVGSYFHLGAAPITVGKLRVISVKIDQ